jgi:Ca-activated chloride channel family protein
VYPPQLPDLFHGGQVQVLGRFTGKGPSAIKLTGQVGMEQKEFAYDLSFPEKTADDKEFVEHIWARRKVGYMLDQIRAHGESKELKDEVIALAKKYGITTPYTSWLIAPDAPLPVAGAAAGWGMKPGSGAGGNNGGFGGLGGGGFGGGGPGAAPAGLARPGGATQPALDFAKQNQSKPGELAQKRDKLAEAELSKAGDGKGGKDGVDRVLGEAKAKKDAFDQANAAFLRREHYKTQAEKLGVDLSVQTANLRNQCRLECSAQKNVQGRTCVELAGVWIDDKFDPKMKAVTVKAQSNAYFRMLERQPKVKDIFLLGNYVVWVTPSGDVLVIDGKHGKEELSDKEIDALFVAKK